ncbi:hypothetical protein CERZMDRAFT_101148 [Cercospora zeae-maydis SCOH1-5]|uniref:Uncharacterized protein n=1 Tax=Cercospora zeae-maydis SCOH1-5 TaxID=717836 RepID=A0A6A6F4L5_9PEZI|nr:hypothetical protein CERZMDRAFT_101148 [Cercospora zeae-maydis SCOH1-5]
MGERSGRDRDPIETILALSRDLAQHVVTGVVPLPRTRGRKIPTEGAASGTLLQVFTRLPISSDPDVEIPALHLSVEAAKRQDGSYCQRSNEMTRHAMSWRRQELCADHRLLATATFADGDVEIVDFLPACQPTLVPRILHAAWDPMRHVMRMDLHILLQLELAQNKFPNQPRPRCGPSFLALANPGIIATRY